MLLMVLLWMLLLNSDNFLKIRIWKCTEGFLHNKKTANFCRDEIAVVSHFDGLKPKQLALE